MALLGIITLVLSLFIAPVLSVIAIIRGYKGMKMSKCLETTNKKVKMGYWLASAIHMWAGILITLCYVIASVFIMAQF